MTKTMPWAAEARPFSATLLHLVAGVLQAASAMLTRLAEQRVVAAQDARAELLVETVEFHALYRDAGAPEGALYINGKLVAVVPGVTRL